MEGRIVSINIKPTGGVLKYIRPEGAVLGKWGFEGDYHNREMRPSFSEPGTMKLNVDRHVSIVAREVIEALRHELPIVLIDGSLGENITTLGLGDLSQIPDGARLFIYEKNSNAESAILRVTKQNKPCKNLSPIHIMLAKKIYGRRGILCAIERGVGNRIMPDDRIEVVM